MPSVGIRTTGRKCSRWVFKGGQSRKACWFEVERHDLHPTKGWRLIGRKRIPVSERDWLRAPATEERFEPKRRPGPVRSAYDPPVIPERALLRHAWYRRQKEREARAAAKEAWDRGALVKHEGSVCVSAQVAVPAVSPHPVDGTLLTGT